MLDNSFDVVIAHFRIDESDIPNVDIWSATAVIIAAGFPRHMKLTPPHPLRAVIDRESSWIISEHVVSRDGSPIRHRGAIRWDAASMTVQIESESQVWHQNDRIIISAS